MKFSEIQYGSPEYAMECELRDAELRAPLGLRLGDEDLSEEIHQRHFGLFRPDGTLAGCAIAVAISPGEMKIRQMAVRGEHQRQGHGRALMTRLLRELASSGSRKVTLHARANVIGFYESMGFARSGELFTEVGIPHARMTRLISPAPE